MIPHNGGYQCPYCGRWWAEETQHQCDSTWRAGDDLENWLASLGIFKERWVAVKEKLGLPPHCNCEARKQWLNKASAHLQTKVKHLKQALEAYYSKPR